MMFVALFFAYAVVRVRLDAWPGPTLSHLPRALPLFNTGVIAASSLALFRSSRAVSPDRWVLAALVLGVAFLGLQVSLWSQLSASGIHLREGTLPGIVYGLTALHGAHLLVGVLGLAAVLATGVKRSSLELWSAYWHFVGVVWVAVLVFVFLI